MSRHNTSLHHSSDGGGEPTAARKQKHHNFQYFFARKDAFIWYIWMKTCARLSFSHNFFPSFSPCCFLSKKIGWSIENLCGSLIFDQIHQEIYTPCPCICASNLILLVVRSTLSPRICSTIFSEENIYRQVFS